MASVSEGLELPREEFPTQVTGRSYEGSLCATPRDTSLTDAQIYDDFHLGLAAESRPGAQPLRERES